MTPSGVPRDSSVTGFFGVPATRALRRMPDTETRRLLKRPVMRSATRRAGGAGRARRAVTSICVAAMPGSSIRPMIRPRTRTTSPASIGRPPTTSAGVQPGISPPT